MAYYTSDLISGLAMGPPLPSVNTIEDINRDSKLTLGWRKGSSLGEMFQVKWGAVRVLWVAVGEPAFLMVVAWVCGVGVDIIFALCQHH